jgi:hypothetical protein
MSLAPPITLRQLSHFIAQACKCAKCAGEMHLRLIPRNDPDLAVYAGKFLVHLRCK